MSSSIKKFFLAPRIPNIAAGFVDGHFAIVGLRRTKTGLELSSSALTSIPDGLLTPAFEGPNIQDAEQMVQIVTQTAEAAGFANRKKWSVAIPDGAARTVIVTIEGKPGSRHELNEMVLWKTERAVGTPSSELRVTRQKLSQSSGNSRYLVTAAREDVMQEYEALFAGAGWQPGLVLPKYLGEAQWLLQDQQKRNTMLISANQGGFTSVIVSGGEVALVRSHECSPESISDELYRVALYYRDRIAGEAARPVSSSIERLLVIGDVDRDRAIKAVIDATGEETRIASETDFGLDLTGEPVSFDQLAGVAGLCTMAWA